MTYQPKVYRKQGGNELVVASGGKITVESGGELELAAGATLDLGDGLSAPADITLADGKIIVGNASAVGAAVTPSGDVTVTNTGVTAIGAGKVTQAMDVAASRDGTVVKVAANANVIGAIPVVHRIDIAAGALADTDVVLTHKTRVIDAWVVLTGAGVANTTLKVQNGATTITNAMDVSGSDKALIRAATIDDAQHEIAAAGTLRIKTETGATQPACTVYVTGLRVA